MNKSNQTFYLEKKYQKWREFPILFRIDLHLCIIKLIAKK